MADTKISALSSGSALTGTELFPSVATAGVGPVTTTAAQIKTFTNTSPAFTGAVSHSGAISSTAWTTNGAKVKFPGVTLTDTSSTGTVASAYSSLFGGDTVAASSATTYTDYHNVFFGTPVASTNVTMTNKYSVGVADSIAIVSSSALLAFATATGANLFTLQYLSGSNSIEHRIGRNGSGSDHVFRNSSNIQARIQFGATNGAAQMRMSEAVSIAAGGTNTVGFTFFSTTNFGVFGGSGAPTLSAAKGSLYLRSDGSATNNRAYINTDGSTTWTALTTAA